MPKTDNSPTPDTQTRVKSLSNEEKHFMEESLSIDKMRLTVTNIYPAFQKKYIKGTPQEKGGRGLYIFKKNALIPLKKGHIK